MIEAGLVDKIYAFIAPKIIGGRSALTPVEGNGFENLKDSINIKDITTEQIDSDILITGYIS